MLLKSATLLLPTPAAIVRLYAFVRFGDFYYGYVAVVLLVGFYLIYVGFRPPGSAVHRELTHGAGVRAS
jgi:hypothetical protein